MPAKDKLLKRFIQIGKRYQGLRYLMLAVIACVLAVYYGSKELKRIIGGKQMRRRFAAAMLCVMLVFAECAPAAYAATGEEAGIVAVPTEDAEPDSGVEPEGDAEPGSGTEPEEDADLGSGTVPEEDADLGSGTVPEGDVDPGSGAESEGNTASDETANEGDEPEDDENLEENPEEIPQETPEEISENLRALQEQINALPTGEEYRTMSADEQDAVYEMAASVSDAYFELSEEDQAKIDITRLEELFAVMNEDVAMLSAGNINYESIDINPISLNGNAIRGVHEGASDSAMDNYAHFYSETHASAGGLPNNGKLTMSSGVPYVLAAGESGSAYDGNDCIRLTSSTLSQTMDLETLGVYQNIYVLATAGGPGSGHYADFKVTLTYTDGTSEATTYKLYDWYDTTSVENVEKYYNIMRMQNGGSYTDGSTSAGPVLHSASITVDSTRLLKQITFTMNGKDGNASDMSGLYCCIFAVTGATPAGVPTAPVATAATKNEGDTSGRFAANWNAVTGATSYRLDVATDRKFTSILSDYNNKNVDNVTSVEVSGNNINADMTYYYRVRAVNDKGQSLSSNRISTDLPIWLKNALADTDYDDVEYDAEQNKITFKQSVELKDTIVLPEEDATTIELGGNQITAPEGKPAVSAGNGTNVELIISNSGGEGNGGITGNGTDENGNGAPVIDFSSATGNNKIELEQTTITGSDGADGSNKGGSGGSGGAGIAAGSSTQTTVGTGSNVIGGKGGDSTDGSGGKGGAGITGGNTVVDEGGNVTGGDGGNSPVDPGEGGSAGTTGGKNGEDGKRHAHSWVYEADGKQIIAYCTQTQGADYCAHQKKENAIKLTLVASNADYSGNSYQEAYVNTTDIEEWEAANLVVPRISYSGTGDTNYLDSDVAPVNAGTYEASITVGDQTAKVAFTIRPKSITATDVITEINETNFKHDGSVQSPLITVTDKTRNTALVADTDYELSGDISKTDVCTETAYRILITGKGNYTGTVERTWRIVETIQTIKITPPTATPITYGALLADSKLIGGAASIEGSSTTLTGIFAWEDSSIKPSVSDSNVKAYNVIFTPYSQMYDPVTCQVKLEVRPKPVKLLWTPLSFTYNGTSQTPNAMIYNLEDEDKNKVAVTVIGGGVNANSADPADVYIATASALSGAASQNYTLSDTANIEKNYKIYPKQITDAMVSVRQTSFTSAVSDIAPYLSVKDGNQGLAKDTHYDLAGAVSTSAIGTYTVEVSGKGNYAGTVTVTYKITDSTPPQGKITLDDGIEWNRLTSYRREYQYKEKQTVTITAEDDESGIASIGYFLTSGNAEVLNETALAVLPDSKWTAIANGGTFTLESDNKYVIYAKITDGSGNVTFLSTDMITIDANAPTINGIEDGKSYCSDVTFTISDKMGVAYIYIDNVRKQVSDANYKISATDTTQEHTIAAWDQVGNETRYTITINANGAHSVSDSDWVVTTAATCDNKGVKSRKCPTCGFVETKEIPALGHVYQAASDSDVRFVWTAETDGKGVVTGYDVTANFKCIHDPQHVDSKTCTVTSVTDENGTVYTATVTYNERVFSTQKQIEPISKNRVDSVNDEDSNIYTATDVVKGAPATSVVNLNKDIAKSLMTEEEKANYESTEIATDVIVYLQVQNITGTTEANNSKNHVEAQLQDLVIQAENMSDGSEVQSGTEYLDLSMYKTVKTQTKDGDQVVAQDESLTKITNVPDKLTITIAIPSDLRDVPVGYKRTYHVIRVHDNQAEVLDTTQTGNQLTFETDKFSTYAITYVDTKDTSVTPPAESGSSDSSGGTVITPKPEKPEKEDPKKEEAEKDDPEKGNSESGKDTDINVDRTFHKLPLVEAKATKTAVKVSWKQVADADGYVLYGAPCNTKTKTYKFKKLAVIKNGTKISYADKNLKSGAYYKYYIKAYKLVDGKKVWLAKSKVIHVTTTGGKYGNAKAVKVNKTSVSLTKGKTFTIKATQVTGSKPIQNHVKIKYESTNKKVATVNSKGVIKAKKKGTCYIYVYAQNGVYKKIKVTVK